MSIELIAILLLETWGTLFHSSQLVLAMRMALDDDNASVARSCLELVLSVIGNVRGVRSFLFDFMYLSSIPHSDHEFCDILERRQSLHIYPTGVLSSWNRDAAGKGWTVGDDCSLADRDVIAGLLEMGLLYRIRVFLQLRNPSLLPPALKVLVAVGRHSPLSSSMIMDCPGLLSELTSLASTLPRQDDAHVLAVRVLRLLCSVSADVYWKITRSGAWLMQCLPLALMRQFVDVVCFRCDYSPLC